MDPPNRVCADNLNAFDESHIPSGFFVLRTPLLPIEDFLAISCPDARGDDPRSSPLRRWAERPEVKEALWIASPEFANVVQTWCFDSEARHNGKLERALYRYLARMTARATPFGSLAGCTVGAISDRTTLELSPRSRYQRRTRVRMEHLCHIAAAVADDPLARCRLHLHANPTLHLAAGKYHHIQGQTQNDGGSRLYHLVATDPTPALRATLERAFHGTTCSALAAALAAEDREISLREAEDFVARLVQAELLLSDLMPPVTGAEPICHMIDQLKSAGISALADSLCSITGDLRALDRGGLGADLKTYDTLSNHLALLAADSHAKPPFQMDMIKPATTADLDLKLVREILRAIHVLHSIQDGRNQDVFEEFKIDFANRYGDVEVPLLQALDDEAGIGFERDDDPMAEPLLAGLSFRELEETTLPDEAPSSSPLGRRLDEVLANGSMVLELDDSLLEELRVANPPPLPDALAVMGILFSGAHGSHGFYLQSVWGPSGANLLARFCHVDPGLAERVEAHLRTEEALAPDGAILAEIAHLLEAEVGNIACRPVLRDYEIPYLATSTLPPQRQIALSDLVIYVRAGRVVLRSLRLGREVLPRLTMAHNFTSSRCLKLYKFLCLLQNQGVSSDLGWNWGALENAEFLPRVQMGNIVFSLARWTVSEETAGHLRRAKVAEQQARIRQWREDLRIPRFVYITELDHQLLIDFESNLGIDTFMEHIGKHRATLLVEMFPAPDALVVRGPEGSFVHEMVVPFTRRERTIQPVKGQHPKTTRQSAPSMPKIDLGRDREWLFAKLYCSASHADRLLLELVKPLVAQAASDIGEWFFVRYADPHWHLRLRLRGAPPALRDHVLPRLLELAKQHRHEGTLWRIEFDAYVREVDRYGGANGMDVAERLFQLDSELCLDSLALIRDDSGSDLRWQIALSGVDRLLTALGLDIKRKKVFVESMRAFHERDYHIDRDYKAQLARAFRRHRSTVSALLQDSTPREIPAAASALDRFAIGVTTLRAQLETLHRENRLTSPVPQLAESFVHMHLNRILRSSHHAQETVLYDFLARGYTSDLTTRSQR